MSSMGSPSAPPKPSQRANEAITESCWSVVSIRARWCLRPSCLLLQLQYIRVREHVHAHLIAIKGQQIRFASAFNDGNAFRARRALERQSAQTAGTTLT